MSTRKEKGKVAVESINGWLRLRWRVGGKQFSLRIGLPDSKANYVVAQNKSNQIYLDIISGNFDPSLDKYRPERTEIVKPAKQTLNRVYDRFCHHKVKELDPRTYEKYVTVGKQLKTFHQEKDIALIASEDVEGFWHHLEKMGLEKITRKGKAVLLASFGEWAVEHKFLEKNFWQDMPKWVRLTAPETPKPFTPEETRKIIEGFKHNRYYHYYYPFVLFSFNTGARIAEVIGLQWKRVSEDFSVVEVVESLSRGVRKPTKTNRSSTARLKFRHSF
jgi:integrase